VAEVHATAIVDPRAELADGVVIGAYAVVEGAVSLGVGCVLHAHAVVRGPTMLGAGNVVHSFAVVGGEPQAKKHDGGPARLEVGRSNVFREHVTVHGGTEGRTTRVGDDNLFMVGSHVAHDCQVGSSCVLANCVQLAGHCSLENWVTLGGLSGVAQFVCIGESAFVAATSACEGDVPPFVIVQGDRARVRGINVVGLRRRSVAEASITALERAAHLLWLSGRTRADALAQLRDNADPYVGRLVSFLNRRR
jgi:UDP-N-acetylglucosamine acyltransferase